MFCKKGVHRNFAKFPGEHLRQSLFFNKVADSSLLFTHLVKEQTWKNGSIKLRIIMNLSSNLNLSQEVCLESEFARPNSGKVVLLKISKDWRFNTKFGWKLMSVIINKRNGKCFRNCYYLMSKMDPGNVTNAKWNFWDNSGRFLVVDYCYKKIYLKCDMDPGFASPLWRVCFVACQVSAKKNNW